MGTQNNILPLPSNTSAKDTQEHLQSWIERMRPSHEIFLDAYCIVDLQNRVLDFNVAFSELCGESYRKVLKIGDFCELLRTELCPHQCPSKQIVTSERSLRLDELKASSRVFPELQLILAGIPIFFENKQILGSLITVRNVSAESELQKKYDERKTESVTDGLTRLYNKKFAETTLLRLVKTSLRAVQSFSVLLCDIDHFKKVNDTYGHQAGDYVLSTIAQMLKGEARDSDIVGRFGGEEFIVLLTNTDTKGCTVFGERFRKRVAQTQVMFEGRHIPVTVSCGTATFGEKWLPGTIPENLMKELINKADMALYYAKANGRNQIQQFEFLPKK